MHISVTDQRPEFNPYLVHQSDVEIEQTGNPVVHSLATFGRSVRTIQCGAFWQVEYQLPGGGWEPIGDDQPVTLSDVNKGNFANGQLIPIHVTDTVGFEIMFIHVHRARRLLRRSNQRYQIVVNEIAAMLARLEWRVERSRPVCYGGARGRDGSITCPNTGVHLVNKGDVLLTMCNAHHAEYGITRAQRRAARR